MNTSSTPEHRLRDRLREQTRASILEAAEAVIAAEGLDAARIEHVAASAGVAVGTVYNYFGDREKLREALLETRRQDLLQRVDVVLGETEALPFAQGLEAFIHTILEHFEEHGAVFQLLLEEEVARYRPGAGRPSTMRELVRLGERLIARGVAQGAVREDDRELMPTMLLSQIRGAVRYAMHRSPPTPMVPLGPRVARSFLHGAGAPTAG